MAISDAGITAALTSYLTLHPDETAALSEAARLLATGKGFASRKTFPMHVTAGALLIRGGEILLVEHRAYRILLQPGGHIEPTDASLLDAAVRELAEETGIAPSAVAPTSLAPAYIEYGLVPARPDKGEPAHHHLDFGYAFTTAADAGRIQESEVTSAGWYPLADLLRDVMRDSGLVAVTKVTMRERESLAVLRVLDDVLLLQTIRWPDELRPTEGIKRPPADEAVHANEIKMILQLAEAKSAGYELAAERDAYVTAMNELLRAKAGGGEVEHAAEPAAREAPPVDIMAALRASIAETQAARQAAEKPAKKTAVKKTAKRTPRRAS